MWADVVDLRDFYASSLGQTALRLVRRRLREMWPDVGGQRVLGLGYATPFLRPFLGEAERVMALMPAPQGVLHWPPEGPNATVLADETELPLAPYSVDRILLVHALECSDRLRPMLQECWRVLAGGGRLIAVVPNRRGIWARFDHTPFGLGHPYTAWQLSRLLRDNMFMPMQTGGALFVPPVDIRMILASAPAWERVAARWFARFAGVVLIEATKQLYAPNAERAERRASYRRRMMRPALPAPVRRD